MKTLRIFSLIFIILGISFAQQNIKLINSTYLGNERRNYYGENAPGKLDIIWKTDLGEGLTKIGDKERLWKGSGWTGQPLMLWEDGKLFLIQGSLDHHLKKINASNGDIIWEYEFPGAIKGTGTLWTDVKGELLIIQGSRRGPKYSTWSSNLHPLRAVSYQSGKEVWRYHLQRGASYSVDVDGTPLIVNDTVYIGLENGNFVVFDPAFSSCENYKDHKRPITLEEHPLYHKDDKTTHGQNLITESSPARIGNHIYITAGSGHVYGYNLETRSIDWDFFVGADMDGSPTVTYDNCILVSVEKQYIEGQGGAFKLDPSKPADSSCVVWYFATENDTAKNATWGGGVIGTVSVNDISKTDDMPHLAGISAIDGYLYLLEHDQLDTAKVWGPNKKHQYFKPHLIASRWIGKSISTPLFIGNRIVAASYSGVSLFEFDEDKKLQRLERRYIGGVESTPFVYDGRIYVGSRDGFLYCLGE
ncbi:MAG: PQQ-binding-like beta-propeller repeat protein [Candidatus Marinimicrobia bacterium]|nr:PQQ-binding-like beta-propeller repeat protein [Candidatus Neomarinimicrobiota bacterium]